MPQVHLVLWEKDVSKPSQQQAEQRQLLALFFVCLFVLFVFLIDDIEGNPSPAWE